MVDRRCLRLTVVVDLRSLVRADVLARDPVDQREEESVRRFVELFDALSDPFAEEADPVHVTASSFVVGERGMVLHKHRRLGIWLQPGGHIDPGETPWDASVRETVEETGLDVRLLDRPADGGPPPPAHVDVHPGPRGHTHLDLRYLVGGTEADPSPPEGESPDVAWFDFGTALQMAEPGLAGAIRMLQGM